LWRRGSGGRRRRTDGWSRGRGALASRNASEWSSPQRVSATLHLLLYLLLLGDSSGSHHGFVLLEVVNKLPLFVLDAVVYHVNPLALSRAGHARDAACIARGEIIRRGGRLARRGQKLLDHVRGLASLPASPTGRPGPGYPRSARSPGLRTLLVWKLREWKCRVRIRRLARIGCLARIWRLSRRRVRRSGLPRKLQRLLPGNLRLQRRVLRLTRLVGIGRLLHGLPRVSRLIRICGLSGLSGLSRLCRLIRIYGLPWNLLH
jgi:hypothetical protein